MTAPSYGSALLNELDPVDGSDRSLARTSKQEFAPAWQWHQRCDAPARQGETNGNKTLALRIIFRPLTLCSATGTPQRGGPYQSKTGAHGVTRPTYPTVVQNG